MKLYSATLLACLFLVTSIATYLAFQHQPRPNQHFASSTVFIDLGSGHGSGVHIGNGMVVSAWHVVNDKKEISVVDSKGKKHDTEVMWSNEAYDVALLRIKDFKNISVRSLSCRNLSVGEKLSFEGNPFSFELVTTWGRVSKSIIKEVYDWKESYIIDGTLGPGMSGGPALDSRDRVVGINVGLLNGTNFITIVPSLTVCALLAKS